MGDVGLPPANLEDTVGTCAVFRTDSACFRSWNCSVF